MLFWKTQSFQNFEAPQKLQRLIQLSHTPLVQFFVAIVTRYELLIMTALFGIALVFTILHPAFWLTVRRQVAIEFFSVVSQSLAAVLGVLIVFLTMTSQLIMQRRLDDYRALQTQIEQLILLTQTLPVELNVFDEMLVEVIEYLVPLQMKDFPILLPVANYKQAAILEKLLTSFKQLWVEKQQVLSFNARLHLQQSLLVLNNMKEIIDGFLILHNHILEIGRFVVSVSRLSFLLGLSLLFLLLFGIVEVQDKFPDLSFPVMTTLAIWILIALLELVGDTWFIYKNLHGPWKQR
jgi:hypothetical protein